MISLHKRGHMIPPIFTAKRLCGCMKEPLQTQEDAINYLSQTLQSRSFPPFIQDPLDRILFPTPLSEQQLHYLRQNIFPVFESSPFIAVLFPQLPPINQETTHGILIVEKDLLFSGHCIRTEGLPISHYITTRIYGPSGYWYGLYGQALLDQLCIALQEHDIIPSFQHKPSTNQLFLPISKDKLSAFETLWKYHGFDTIRNTPYNLHLNTLSYPLIRLQLVASAQISQA